MLIELSVLTTRYLSFKAFLLACKLCKSGLEIIHDVSDTARYVKILGMRTIVFSSGT